MAKNRTVNTFESVSWKIAHGYGRGLGLEYKPWISGHEFASRGIYVRLKGRTVPRLYCFMSRLEADAFILYDCSQEVTDILEQYYLTLEETLEIADGLRIAHPRSGKYFNAVTTDLLVQKDGQWIARSVKTSRDLENERTLEKLEIERVYFSRRGIDWKIITEKELNRTLVQNLNWLWYGESPDSVIADHQLLLDAEAAFLELYEIENLPFPHLVDEIESRFSLTTGSAVCVFKSLIRRGIIQVDLTKPLNMLNPRIPLERRTSDERYRSYC